MSENADDGGGVPEFYIGRRSRAYTVEDLEARYRHPSMPDRIELIEGQLFGTEERAIAMLGLLLEACGMDTALQLGDSKTWREALDDLHASNLEPDAARSRDRLDRLEALAGEIRKVVENSNWRDRNVYWPEGMNAVEERLMELDRSER